RDGDQLMTIRRFPWRGEDHPEALINREWLVTNGLGGYAAGTLTGVGTRRYHSLLVAALPDPHGRMVMLNHLSEELRLPDGTFVPLGAHERADGRLDLHGPGCLVEFRLEHGLPVWIFRAGPSVVEKRLFMPHLMNTTVVSY